MASTTHIYINTMVFTIIAGILSAALFVLLWMGSDTVREFAHLIITIELGLLAIIIYAVLRVYMYERKLAEQQGNILKNAISVRLCPDYWTMHERNGKRSCNNTYTTPDGASTYVFQGKNNTVDLSTFEGNTVATVCKAIAEQNSPWTDVRAACDSYNISTAPPNEQLKK
jgi:hypothetical protein